MLRVDLRTTQPGILRIEAGAEHCVRIHAGAAVRGEYHRRPFVNRSGDVDILPAGFADAWHEADPGASLMLRFPPSLLERAAREMGVEAARLETRCQLRDARIEHIAWALDAAPDNALYRKSLGMALAAHLVSRYAVVAEPSGITRALAHIERNLDTNLTIDRLAAVASLSPSHFKALFRRATGVPVHRYVVERRVARARELLGRGALSASQVALEAGFAHQSHMARWLRRSAAR